MVVANDYPIDGWVQRSSDGRRFFGVQATVDIDALRCDSRIDVERSHDMVPLAVVDRTIARQ